MLVLLHGYMDVSASFQFLVDALDLEWRILAPDWRGGGLSDWSKDGAYWFLDLVKDLDLLLRRIQPAGRLCLLGHSMGFNGASLYAGLRPERVERLINVECHGFRETPAASVRERLLEWLDAANRPARTYPGYAELAASLGKSNPRLTAERADFLARHMGRQREDGAVETVHDPAQRAPNNKLAYVGQLRPDEALSCWRAVTAPVLWITAELSDTARTIGATPEQLQARKASFPIAREARIEGAGHMVHHEAPERLAEEVRPFLLAGR